ncbi:hypothetical protein GE061_016871 [Apolygus lucorum]|uniref:DNA recombination and repair protein Rad51-like C-terminal domain-containing protein n=1 Tax=Apolygus lucorum TaxID=248454 RepID=A0A8S9XLF0_APOLU|nr:hypothetical protein GE061_016871 [Apolygus lucorum]
MLKQVSMDEEVLEGSALKLFGAYEERPSLDGLNKLLFASGPHPKQVIEISGDAGSGKSYILLDIVAKCLLPREHSGLSIGGLESGVVFLNVDQHLNSFRLVRMMEVRVRRRQKELDEALAEEIISTSLRRLAILDAFSEEERESALQSARNHVFLNPTVSLVVMDSIAAHYWCSSLQGGLRKFDSYVDDILKSVQRSLGNFKITFLYTRPAYFFSKSGLPVDLSSNFNLKNVNSRVVLKVRPIKRAEVHSGSSASFVNSCSYKNCRWNLVRESVDASNVVVDDRSVQFVNWRWDVRGGSWNVTYSSKYPSEWYSGKAVFVNNSVTSSGRNAFVSWGSSIPWMSNAIPIYYASPWNLTYNGDTFGFMPTQDGRYIFRVYSRNKRHNPFRNSEPISNQPCAFTSKNPTEASRWWQEQKSTRYCPNPTLYWTWQAKNGKWTVQYRYVDSTKKTLCDVYYEGNGLPQIKAISWELDENKQSVSFATNPVRIYEDAWQVSLGPTETFGFTPTSNGLWIFQHFSRNLVFQPFQDFRGTVTYGGPNTSGQSAPLYYAVGTPAQTSPQYSVNSL